MGGPLDPHLFHMAWDMHIFVKKIYVTREIVSVYVRKKSQKITMI